MRCRGAIGLAHVLRQVGPGPVRRGPRRRERGAIGIVQRPGKAVLRIVGYTLQKALWRFATEGMEIAHGIALRSGLAERGVERIGSGPVAMNWKAPMGHWPFTR